MASNANLIISITAKDTASGAVKRVKANLGDLERSSSDLGDSVGGLGDIFGSTLGKVGAGIGAAFAVEKMASAAFELGKVGAAAERTQASFETMAAGVGSSGEEMLAAMQQATAGTVSNSELMLAANRAIMLGVADNADEMSRLMAAAIERGRALGVSASQAVSDVITGIGRMSPQILDNLGIVGATKAIDDYAKSLGKTSEQLTDVERKQALVNVVLAGASGATVADDAAASFERMDAAIQNAKEALGILFSPAIAAIAEQIAAATIAATDAMQDQADASQRTLDIRQKVAGTLAYDRLAGVDDQSSQFRILNDALAETERRSQAAMDSMQALAQDAQRQIANIASTPGMDPNQAAAEFQAMLQDAISMSQQLAAEAEIIRAAMGGIIGPENGLEEYNRQLWDTVSTWQEFRTEAEIAADAVVAATDQIVQGASGGLAQIARSMIEVQGSEAAVNFLRGANDQLEIQVGRWAEAGYSVQEITSVLLPQYLDNLGKIVDATQAAYTATAQTVDIQPVVDSVAGSLNNMAQSLAAIKGTDNALAWLETAKGQVGEMVGKWLEQGYTIEHITGVILPNYIAGLDQIIQREIQAATFGEQIGIRIAGGLNVAIGAANTLVGTLGTALSFAVDAITGIANSAMPALNSQASQYVEQMGPSGALGWLEDQKTATQAQIVAWMQAGYTVDEIQSVLLPSYLSQMKDVNKTIASQAGGVSAVASEFDDLRSKVQGIIDQSTTLDVGLNPADFLPREDAINENARRLAAIMRDGLGNQEWMEEFKAEVPALWEELSTSGDPKTAAARMLQEFQAGLRPELLDKQMIKDRVKAMILGDQSSADLANEIAQEISSELGVSLAQAQQAVGATLGTGGMLPTGEQAGPDAAQPAENFVNKWAATVTGMVSTFDNTGRTAGNAFGTGFMAVQGAYIDQWAAALVSIVTAGVLANMAAQASRTGAR